MEEEDNFLPGYTYIYETPGHCSVLNGLYPNGFLITADKPFRGTLFINSDDYRVDREWVKLKLKHFKVKTNGDGFRVFSLRGD